MNWVLNLSGLPALVWLVARVALGWHFLDAGLNKLGESAWTGSNAGAAVSGFLNGAIEKAEAPVANPEVGAWFATLAEDVFLPNADILGYLVVAGEIGVGVALLAGFFTKFSASVGVIMNLAFLLAGTTSSNPYMILIAFALIVANRPGYIGVDYFVLPMMRRLATRLLAEAQWRRWVVSVASAGGIVTLGFLSYVMLDERGTFAAIWATSIAFGVFWLLALPRFTSWRLSTAKVVRRPVWFRASVH